MLLLNLKWSSLTAGKGTDLNIDFYIILDCANVTYLHDAGVLWVVVSVLLCRCQGVLSICRMLPSGFEGVLGGCLLA